MPPIDRQGDQLGSANTCRAMADKSNAVWHLLLTRFSVLISPDAAPPSDDWLRDRLDLFRRYAVPSVCAQNVWPDGWLVFCSQLSDWLQHELDQIQQDVPFLKAVSIDGELTLEAARSAVRSEVPKGAEKLTTTRLDSDDAISQGYLEAVRIAAQRANSEFLNATHGLQLHKGRLYHRSDPSNAFISFVEPAESPKTVFVGGHHELAQFGLIRQFGGRAMWLQVVHGGNVSNQVSGCRRRLNTHPPWPVEIAPTLSG